MYSYNRSQQRCTISQLYFDIQLYILQTDLLSVIRSPDTVFTANGICHTIYVNCLLARLRVRLVGFYYANISQCMFLRVSNSKCLPHLKNTDLSYWEDTLVSIDQIRSPFEDVQPMVAASMSVKMLNWLWQLIPLIPCSVRPYL